MRVRARATRRVSPSHRRAAFWLPDGDWLEHRTLLATSPLSSAVRMQFGVLDDASESHFLSTPGEVDIYSVALGSGEEIDASIDAQNSGSALTSLLRVFGPTGTPLALDDQEGGDPQLTFQAATAGTYYLGVSSAPDDNYNPLVAGSGTPGGSTGLYTLDVRLTSGPLRPDLTGSSFRTGLDMAAPGERVPVSFTVQNRGAADPGNFQVQVEIAPNNLFDSSAQVLATFTRSQLVADATGRSFSSPAGFTVKVPAGWAAGPADLGLRIVADPAVPEAGLYDKSGVHRGSDWEFLTVVTANPGGSADLSAIGAGLNTETLGTLTNASPVTAYTFAVSSALGIGEIKAEVSSTSGTLEPRLTLSGATGQVLIQSDSGLIVQSLQPGTYLLSVSEAAGNGGYRLTTAFAQIAAVPFAPLPSGAGTDSIAVGDLTGDGFQDVVTANRIDDTVSVFLSNGDGTFQRPETYAVGDRVWRVTIADATGNGKLDIVTANKGSNTISILVNNGDGTFQPQFTLPTGTRPGDVTVADLNGDGIPDLIVSNYADDTIWIYLGEGDDKFEPAEVYATDQGGFAGPVQVAVADLTGDGVPDLIYADYVTGNVAVRLGNGDGAFGPETTYPTAAGSHDLAAVDLTGNGKIDLVTVNAVANSVSVLLGNGDGTFGRETAYPVGTNPYSLAIAELNGDGTPDIVVNNRGGNTVSVLLGNGDGTFGPQESYPTGTTPRSVAAVQLVPGGPVDIVTANLGDDDASILLGRGDGTFSFGAEQTAPAAPLAPFQVVVADLNGDGIPDIVTANRPESSVSVLLGNRDGSFQTKETYPTGEGPFSVAVADLTGDGIPDILTANYESATVSVLLGNGDGTFQRYFNLPAGSDPYDVKVADLRGDGKEDIIVTNKNDNDVGVMLGNGNGTFQPMVTYPVASGPYEVVVDDLTGNGIPDLVVSHFSANVVDVLMGNGNGTFQPALEFPVGSHPYGLAVADLNGDGLPDIVTSDYKDNEVSVLLNQGDQPPIEFGPPKDYAVGKGPNEVQVADLTGDGIPDIVTANYGSDTVSVLMGNGNGTFQPQQTFPAGSGPASLAIADLTGNGKLDLVVGNRNASTVSVLYWQRQRHVPVPR